jgi:hypothetical protein
MLPNRGMHRYQFERRSPSVPVGKHYLFGLGRSYEPSEG